MVELVMVPVPPASAPAATTRSLQRSENAATLSAQGPGQKRRDSKHTPKPAKPTPNAGDDPILPPSRLCIRRGKHVRQVSTDLPSPPAHSRHTASDSRLGILSVGLGRELAEELGMLPGTVYTPAP